MRFYVLFNGETKGPFSGEELLEMKAVGEIDEGTNVCQEGENTWLLFSTARKLIEKEKEENNRCNATSSYDFIPVKRGHTKNEVTSNSQMVRVFHGLAIVCFGLAALILLIMMAGQATQVIPAAASFLILALIGLGWLGVAHIISLLERIAENTGKK